MARKSIKIGVKTRKMAQEGVKSRKMAQKGVKTGVFILNNGVRGGVKKRDEKSSKIAKSQKKSVEIDIMT